MFRKILPAIALGAVTLAGSQAQAQFPGPHARPVPVYAPPVHHVHQAPPVYTLDEFIKCFRPTEGRHSVWFIHPKTGRPVEVCFTLPCAKLREVEVHRNSVEFDYSGARDVRIQFHNNGTVDVRGN